MNKHSISVSNPTSQHPASHDYESIKRRKQATLTTVSEIQSLARQQGVNLSYDEAKEISMKIDIARSVEVFNEEQPALFAQKMLREHGINIYKKQLNPQWVYTICMVIFIIIVVIIGTLLGY